MGVSAIPLGVLNLSGGVCIGEGVAGYYYLELYEFLRALTTAQH